MSTDFAVGVTGIPVTGVISKKPPYLILLESFNSKTKTLTKFITLDKPEFINFGFVQAKGIFSEESEEDIIKNYATYLTTVEKDLILEVMFPQHRIHSIRSLVFKAK